MDNRSSTRGQRKLEHIQFSLDQEEQGNGLDDVNLINLSLPELNWTEVDTSYHWLGKKLAQPLLINAMTGGCQDAEKVNAALARVARDKQVAMAVGSQSIALEQPDVQDSFKVARRENPEGILLANVSATMPKELALAAIEMIEADGLQLHLNIPQELAMEEGDRCFQGIIDNIAAIVEISPVPVLAKEVGFGISREAAFDLFRTGVRWVDIGGRGGTDFIDIEFKRRSKQAEKGWGITTAVSLLEVASTQLPLKLIATGGISSGLEVAKTIALGAEMAAAAGRFLRILVKESEEALRVELDRFELDLKKAMLQSGVRTLAQLRGVPVIVGGKVKEWLDQRCIDTSYLARR